MIMRWLPLGLLLGALTFACGEDAPPIAPPPEVAQTTQNATEATAAAKDAGTDAEKASAPMTTDASTPPAVETKQNDGDDDDDAQPSFGACLLQCGTDLACTKRCLAN